MADLDVKIVYKKKERIISTSMANLDALLRSSVRPSYAISINNMHTMMHILQRV